MKKTAQTGFWEGSFGDSYVERNDVSITNRTPFFSKLLQKTFGVSSICELGANKGHNLQVLASLSPNFELTGVEVNRRAFDIMKKDPRIEACHTPIQDFTTDRRFDLVFLCGVLIHVAPADLPLIYRKMFDLSKRYVMMTEYFNPSPVELEYRGHQGKLFKRDFGGEFLDACAGKVRLVDYGFLWKRCEPAWDNMTWWLFEKLDAKPASKPSAKPASKTPGKSRSNPNRTVRPVAKKR